MPRTVERVAYLPDIHAPYHDEPALVAALRYVRQLRPHVVYQLGDLVDFYPLSRFDRDPARADSLQDELDQGRDILRRIRAAAGKARLYLIKGNHEHRLTRYLWQRAPEMSGLRGLRLPALLGLDELDIRYVDRGVTLHRDRIVKHGTLIRQRAGYTATGEMERAGQSGVSGHSHRLGHVHRRNYRGRVSDWIEAGCLCRMDPEYMEGATVDWCHGLAAGEWDGKRFRCRVERLD